MINVKLDLSPDEGRHLHKIAGAWSVSLDEAAVTLLRHGLAHVGQIEPVEPGDTPTGFGMLIQLTDEQAAALAREAKRRECVQEDLMSSAIFRYAESLVDREDLSLAPLGGQLGSFPGRLVS